MAREEIGLQPRSKVILSHAQQDFDTIYIFRGFSFLSIFRVPGKTSVIRVLGRVIFGLRLNVLRPGSNIEFHMC